VKIASCNLSKLAVALSGNRITITLTQSDWQLLVERELPCSVKICSIDALERVSMFAEAADHRVGSPEGPAFLCSLFEYAQVGVVQIRSDGRLHWANAALCRMLGYNPKELIDRNFADLLASPNETHRIKVEKALSSNKGNFKAIEECLLHRSGIPVWISMSSLASHQNPSNLHTSVIRFRDVRKMSADEGDRTNDSSLHRGEDELRLLLDSTVEGIIAIDLEGRFTFCNRSARQMLGYESSDRLIGRDIHALIHHTRRDGSPCDPQDCSILKVFHKGESAYLERELLWRADGTSLETELWCRPRRLQEKLSGAIIAFLDITPRLKALQDLEKSEQKFAKAFRESPIALSLTRISDQQYVDVNQTFERLIGYQREEIVGRTPFDLGLWPVPDERNQLIRKVLAGERVHEIERTICVKDGTLRIVLGSMELLEIENEQVILSTILDITDRKRALSELQESEERFRTIFNDAPAGMALSSLSGRFIFINKAFYEFLGYTRNELSAKDLLQVTYAEDRAAVEKELIRFREGQVPQLRTERRYLHKNGQIRWGEVKTSIIHDSRTGNPKYIVSQILDVSERKQAEQALRETEERFRTIANSAPVLIWMTDTSSMRTYFNRPWLEFTGRSLEAEVGNRWLEGVHLDDVGAYVSAFTGHFDGHVPFTVEYRLRRHDGKYRWIQETGVPRWNPDGSFAGYIGSGIDQTERREAEESNRNVSKKLIEAQEKERRRIARELHDDINQRLAMLAIELQQLDKPGLFRGRSHGEIQRLFRQTTEISSSLQALSHELHSSSLEHLGLMSAVKAFCNEFARLHKVRIEYKETKIISPVSPEIALALFRVVQEGLHNALKHSGMRKFRVELSEISGAIQLTVSDSGVGFDPQAVRNGEGLGLVSMKERILPLKGTLTIHSQPKRGTELVVRVPVSQSSTLPGTEPAAS
jgi:PAS domain S-box-containing protein